MIIDQPLTLQYWGGAKVESDYFLEDHPIEVWTHYPYLTQ